LYHQLRSLQLASVTGRSDGLQVKRRPREEYRCTLWFGASARHGRRVVTSASRGRGPHRCLARRVIVKLNHVGRPRRAGQPRATGSGRREQPARDHYPCGWMPGLADRRLQVSSSAPLTIDCELKLGATSGAGSFHCYWRAVAHWRALLPLTQVTYGTVAASIALWRGLLACASASALRVENGDG
jgi:hypothetical protein